MTKRAVIYARVSYDDRDNEGRDLVEQIRMGREHAQKKGYEIIDEMSEDDRGASGAEINLPQLNKVREMARAKSFDVLVIRELDRFSRNLAKQLTVEEELKRNGVMTEYVKYDYPPTLEGNMMKQFRGAIAEYERGKIRERMSRGKRLTVGAGFVMTASGAPYGYRSIRQENSDGRETHLKLEIHPTEAAIVRQIYKWFAVDFLPLGEIARRLDQSGAPVPSSGGRKRTGDWPRTTVRKIIEKETYIGTWHYKHDDNKVDGGGMMDLTVKVPAIVEVDLWNAAQVILQKNKEVKAHATKYDFLFARRVTCARCGRLMNVRAQLGKNGKYSLYYYACGGPKGDRKNICPGQRVRADKVDAWAWNWLTDIMRDPDKLQNEIDLFRDQQNRQMAPLMEQLKITEELLADNKGKLNRLIDLYVDGVYSLEIVTERKAALERTIASLETQRAGISQQLERTTLTPRQMDDLKAIAANVQGRMENATFEEKRQLFNILHVSGMLQVDENGKMFHARCIVGADTFMIYDTASRCCSWR